MENGMIICDIRWKEQIPGINWKEKEDDRLNGNTEGTYLCHGSKLLLSLIWRDFYIPNYIIIGW